MKCFVSNFNLFLKDKTRLYYLKLLCDFQCHKRILVTLDYLNNFLGQNMLVHLELDMNNALC